MILVHTISTQNYTSFKKITVMVVSALGGVVGSSFLIPEPSNMLLYNISWKVLIGIICTSRLLAALYLVVKRLL